VAPRGDPAPAATKPPSLPRLATALALAIATLAVFACDRPRAGSASPTRAEPPRAAVGGSCGSGRADPARAQRIRTLLGRARAGLSLLERERTPLPICFAEVPVPSITTERTITLDERDSDAENAARLAHLLLHAFEGAPLPDDFDRSRSCASVVRDAVRAEARAHALELQLRRELGATRPRRSYAFERDYWGAPADRRLAVLESYFWAHPHGGGGLPAFVEELGRRCASLKRGPNRTGETARPPAR
jgi:transcriptional regulator of met regulon